MPTPQPAPERGSSLAALAEEGRALREAALASEAAETRRRERKERREAERIGRGFVRTALIEAPRGRTIPLLPSAMALVCLGTLLLIVGEGRVTALGLPITLLTIGWYFGARWLRGRLQLRRERAWLRTLPFPVRGYFRVLCEAPQEERTVRAALHFRDAAPDPALLDGLLGRVQSPASVRVSGGSGARWKLESGDIRSYVGDDIDPTNASVLWWMRAVIEDALLPLHREYPIAGVRFRG